MSGMVLCAKGKERGVFGIRAPKCILLTKRKSPTSNDFSIEGVGMVYASRTNVLIMVAAITAKMSASIHSRVFDFFFLLFFVEDAVGFFSVFVVMFILSVGMNCRLFIARLKSRKRKAIY